MSDTNVLRIHFGSGFSLPIRHCMRDMKPQDIGYEWACAVCNWVHICELNPYKDLYLKSIERFEKHLSEALHSITIIKRQFVMHTTDFLLTIRDKIDPNNGMCVVTLQSDKTWVVWYTRDEYNEVPNVSKKWVVLAILSSSTNLGLMTKYYEVNLMTKKEFKSVRLTSTISKALVKAQPMRVKSQAMVDGVGPFRMEKIAVFFDIFKRGKKLLIKEKSINTNNWSYNILSLYDLTLEVSEFLSISYNNCIYSEISNDFETALYRAETMVKIVTYKVRRYNDYDLQDICDDLDDLIRKYVEYFDN